MANTKINTDICIVGGGLVGLAAALKLSQKGFEVILCGPKQTYQDGRTTALLMQSIAFLEEIGIWGSLEEKAFPLKTMRIVDGTDNLLRAPQTDFHASEIGLEAFGYNLRNQDTLSVLEGAINAVDNITRLEGLVDKIHTTHSLDAKEVVDIRTDNEQIQIHCGFVVGADGRNSIVRKAKNISVKDWEYPQVAMVLDFEHERSTQYTSTEFHTKSGPFTIVPHTHKCAGLVWMEKPKFVQTLLEKSNEKLALIIERKMQSFLGKVTIKTKPQSFPLKGLVANQFGDHNHALIGEAAHVFPPIGAQGFNLGIRDIEGLSEVLSRYTNQENRGIKYDTARKVDITSRTYGVDLLNRSLISEFLPTQIVRSLGLHALGSIAPLRKYAMKIGISPSL